MARRPTWDDVLRNPDGTFAPRPPKAPGSNGYAEVVPVAAKVIGWAVIKGVQLLTQRKRGF